MPRRPYDDDDDDRPMPRRRSVKKDDASSSTLLLVLGLVGGGALLLCGCGGLGFAGYWLLGGKNNEPAPPMPIEQPIARAGPGIEQPRDNRVEPPKDPFRDKKIDNPPDQVKPVQAAGTRFLIDGKSSMVKDIVFAPQAQGVGVLYWESGVAFKKYFDYWDWKTPKRLTHIDLPDDGQAIGLSPKGTRFLLHRNAPQGLTGWSLPDGQQLFKDWNPYARDPKQGFKPNAPELVFAYYLDEDRLLTVSRTGQFDVWSMGQRQVVASNPAPAPPRFLVPNFFARAPQDFALSPDCRFFAFNNGDGFEIFDAATAKKVGKTQSFAQQGMVGNVWAVAFNRAGTMLACRHNLQSGAKRQEYLTTWEVPGGARKHQVVIPAGLPDYGPICWLGPRHLMFFDGNVFKGQVFSLDDGRYHRVCEGVNPGDHFARQGPDDRIWYQTGAAINAPAQIVAVDFPENDLGLQPAPQGANIPRWFCSPAGITRTKPGGGF